MIAAVFGFVGVLVGALATAASTWFFTRRRERREEAVAVRLIREDVILAGSTLENVLRNGWFPEFNLPLEDWREHRASLAEHLELEEWNRVADAMGYLNRIEVMLNSVGNGEPIEPDEIPDGAKEVIEEAVEKLKQANGTLWKMSKA